MVGAHRLANLAPLKATAILEHERSELQPRCKTWYGCVVRQLSGGDQFVEPFNFIVVRACANHVEHASKDMGNVQGREQGPKEAKYGQISYLRVAVRHRME